MKRHARGLTLLELLIALSIAAILVTVGIPSFRDLLQNNRVTTQANELLSALQFARMEAVKRGTPVTVEVAPVGTTGWTATVSSLDDTALRVTERNQAGISLDAGATVTFAGTGFADADYAFGLAAGNRSRAICVRMSGQVRVDPESCT